MERYDVVVVGGGPGGYPAAIRAAELGARVALVERDVLGGECTNYGCMPTKALLAAAAAVYEARRWGGVAGLDPGRLAERVRELVQGLRTGIGQLLESHGVHVYHGVARLAGREKVVVEEGDGREELVAGRLVLAPGSEPFIPGPLRVEGVLDNRGLLSRLDRPPESILIVGGGPVGVEFAQALAVLGSRVTVAEMMPRLLPGMERGLGLYASRLLRRLGVGVRTRCPVEGLSPAPGGGFEARLCGSVERFEAVLVAVGRRPRTTGLGFLELDDKGFIRVSERMETSVPGVYASGDATGPPLLAHKAIHQALVAGENAAGGSAGYEGKLVPMVVYGLVELAQVGFPTAEEAAAAGYEAAEARVRLGAVSYAHVADAVDGYAKVVYDRRTGRLLGFTAAAPHASDLAAAAATAVAAGLTVEEASEIVYPHPSAVEALYEALMLARGAPLHYLVRRR